MAQCKAFLDTNVVLDFILNREGADVAETILCNIDKEDCIMSAASFYTTAYYCELNLKKHGLGAEEKRAVLRLTLNRLIDIVSIAGIDEELLRTGINDTAFSDVEDSFQLQTAIAAGCNVIVTNNIKDFKYTTRLPVMTPEAFVAQYISTN